MKAFHEQSDFGVGTATPIGAVVATYLQVVALLCREDSVADLSIVKTVTIQRPEVGANAIFALLVPTMGPARPRSYWWQICSLLTQELGQSVPLPRAVPQP